MRSGINDIVLHLLVNNSSSIELMEMDVKQKKSSIKDHLLFLNTCFEAEHKDAIKIAENGSIYITENTREYLYHMLKTSKFMDLNYLTPEIRMNLIIIKLLTDKSYCSLQDLADFVEVSKNTMLHDMKAIKERVHSHFLQVDYSRTSGYKINGSEYNARRLLLTELKQLLFQDFSIPLLEQKKIIDKNEIFFLEKRLMKVESELEIALTDEQIEHLPIILSLLIKRIKEFDYEWSSELDEYELTNTKEYQILKNMFWGITELSEKDKLYLSLQVLSSHMLESAMDESRSEDLKCAVEEFLDLLERNLATDLIRKTELQNKLILHLRPAIYRSWLKLNIQNPVMDQFIKEYYSLYSIVTKSIYPIEHFVGKPFSKEDIVYIAMHIQAWIYQTEEHREYVFKSMIVCRNGTSVSKLLLETLKGIFHHFNFIGAFAERNFKEYEEEVDFIFSTVPLNTSKKTFIVDPVMNNERKTALQYQLRKYIDKDSHKKARELMYHLKDHIDITNSNIIESKIVEFFNQSLYADVKECISENRDNLFGFGPQHILFTEREMSWKEALALAFIPMKKRHSVNEDYHSRVKELFEEEGDRMMIGPAVYIPHAKPCDGVQYEDFSILICKHRVMMPDGQLAKMMIVLAPENYNHHVPTLLYLNEIFLDEAKADKIFQANNKQEVLEIINPVSLRR